VSDAIAVRPSLWGRLTRALSVLLSPETHAAGADYVEGANARPGYDLAHAMSAYAAAPWVKACADAVSEDLAGLPIRVRRGKGAKAVRLDAHPVLDLLEQPSSRTDGHLWRQQIVVDWLLTGNAIVGLYGGQATDGGQVSRPPSAIYRWHPHRTTIRPGPTGEPNAYEHNGAGTIERLPYALILHWRGPSWEDSIESLFGTGAIRALHNDLTAEIASTTRLTESSRQGRPQAIASISGDDPVSPEGVQEIAASLRRAFSKSDGGIAVVGTGIDVSVLGWTPRDMEYGALRTWVRDTVLAVCGVPPTRVGLPMANYATANQQERGYWQSLAQRVAGLDAQLTRLARMFPGSEDVEVYHDFSAVAALQEDRTIRLQRVIDMVSFLGASPADAAAFEGLADLPVGDLATEPPPVAPPAPAAPVAEPVREGSPQGTQRAAGPPPPVGEVARATAWRSWVGKVQGKHERLIAAAMTRFLRGQARRIAAALRAQPERAMGGTVQRDAVSSLMDAIFGDAAEAKLLRSQVEGLVAAALRDAFARAAKDLPGALKYDPVRAGEKEITAELVTKVQQSTKDAIAKIVMDGLEEGETMHEMAARIEKSAMMSPSRALMIARTESNRAANAGAVSAAEQANAELGGDAVELEWLSARDEAVRPDHAKLDQQRVKVGESFKVDGHSAKHPGGFGVPGLDINCRCTTVPVLTED